MAKKKLVPDLPLKSAPVPSVHRSEKRSRTIRSGSSAHVSEAIGPITPGCEIFCMTNGMFSLIDVLQHAIDATGPAHMDVATWTAADGDLRRAHAFMMDGRITGCRFIVDPSFRSRKPEFCASLVGLFGNDAIRSLPLHGKFALIYNDEWSLSIRTSMNLNPNRRIENVEISDDPTLCAHLRGFVDEIFLRSPSANFTSQSKDLISEHAAGSQLAF